MIYQLLRLEGRRTWRGMLVVGIILGGLAFGNLILMSHNLRYFAILPTLLLNFILLTFGWGLGRSRGGLFQAALPIPARDLFMYRLVTLLALVWIPLLAAAGAAYIVVGRASPLYALWLITAGAVSIAWALAQFSVRVREMSAPPVLSGKLLLSAMFLASIVLTVAMAFTVRPGIVLLICAGTIAILLWRDLAVMPKAFQVAPAEAIEWWSSGRPDSSPRPVWWLVFRSIFAWERSATFIVWGPSATLILSVVWLLAPYPFCLGVAPLWFATFVRDIGSSMSWMWALPVSRRKVLALGLVPILVLEAAVLEAKSAGFIQAAVLIALTLLSTSCLLATKSRSSLRPGVGFLAWVVTFIATALDVLLGESRRKNFWRSPTVEYLAAHLARMPLPLHLLLIAGTFIALGGLYWLAQSLFESADFMPVRLNRLGTAEFSIGRGD